MILIGTLIAASGAAYYFLTHRSTQATEAEVAYVLPASAAVSDSPAEIRLSVATLRHGERVEVLDRTRNWARVRIPDGRSGWIELGNILDGKAYEEGQDLFRELLNEQPQASGHTGGSANLRVQPSRDAAQLAQLPAGQNVEIFRRRMVERPPQPGVPASSEPIRDAWYLVRAESKVGWVLGRLVSLNVPAAIENYAQSVNLVAWLVLNTVDDQGRAVPQYLAADREGTPDADFTHVRVFTWWSKRQEYVTAYVESNLKGYFPIRVRSVNGAPHFWLRVEDRNGRKLQKVYRMQDTIVHPIGTVEGWEGDGMPERRPVTRNHRRR